MFFAAFYGAGCWRPPSSKGDGCSPTKVEAPSCTDAKEQLREILPPGEGWAEVLGDVGRCLVGSLGEEVGCFFFLFSPKEALKFQISEYDDYDYDDFFEHHLIKVVCDIWWNFFLVEVLPLIKHILAVFGPPPFGWMCQNTPLWVAGNSKDARSTPCAVQLQSWSKDSCFVIIKWDTNCRGIKFDAKYYGNFEGFLYNP